MVLASANLFAILVSGRASDTCTDETVLLQGGTGKNLKDVVQHRAATPLLHEGEQCWRRHQCDGQGGACPRYCGTQGVCCRAGVTYSAQEAADCGAQGHGIQGMHTCQLPPALEDDGPVTVLPDLEDEVRRLTVLSRREAPPGWVKHIDNWSCGGSGEIHDQTPESTGSLSGCASFCSEYNFAVLWENYPLCRCHNTCDEANGGYSHEIPHNSNTEPEVVYSANYARLAPGRKGNDFENTAMRRLNQRTFENSPWYSYSTSMTPHALQGEVRRLTALSRREAPLGWVNHIDNWSCGGSGDIRDQTPDGTGSLSGCASFCSDYDFAVLWENYPLCRCHNTCDEANGAYSHEIPHNSNTDPEIVYSANYARLAPGRLGNDFETTVMRRLNQRTLENSPWYSYSTSMRPHELEDEVRRLTALSRRQSPPGWIKHIDNWSCGGSGDIHDQTTDSTGSLSGCASFCSEYNFAALWENYPLCRCHNTCDEAHGGYSHEIPHNSNTEPEVVYSANYARLAPGRMGNDFENTVMRRLNQRTFENSAWYGYLENADHPVCPSGYVLEQGDVGGWGYDAEHGRLAASNVLECANFCSADPECKSFEFSPTHATPCNLNNVEHPAGSNNHMDFIFCSQE